MIKNTIIAVLLILILALILIANNQGSVMSYQLNRIDQLEREARQERAEMNRLLEELAGVKIEKVPDDLLIH